MAVLSMPANQCLCSHCGLPLTEEQLATLAADTLKRGEPVFCCVGCQVVYGILQSKGLSRYYELKKNGPSLREPTPASAASSSYAYLNDPEVLNLYVDRNEPRRIQFYLEGVHCAACVWLVEKLPELMPEVEAARLNLGESVATITLTNEGGFARVAQELHQLGYRPHVIKDGNSDAHRKRENRLQLVRIGVAGASHGNIMLLAVSIYAGATGLILDYFKWFSFLLFLPAFFFSAVPFYKNAWAALRTGSVSIDVPLALGIVLGAAASVLNLFLGSDHVYFDSLSGLIFFLLSARYVLRRAQQAALNTAGLLHFLTPSAVRKRNAVTGQLSETSIDVLKPGDVVEVRVGESIPVDGVVLKGISSLNCALLTGESTLVPVREGDLVYAGTSNQETPIDVRVSASGAETRLGKILKATEESMLRKAPIVARADRISRVFVGGVITLATAVFFWGGFRSDWQHGLNLALGLVIITCPCGLALATPLAMIVGLSKAARLGILIKGADVIERLHQAREVFLDKTGTLTEGSFEVLHWTSLEPESASKIPEVIVALESRSNHPIARALVKYFRPKANGVVPAVGDFKEQLGRGVSGSVNGRFFEIRQTSGLAGEVGSSVGLYRDGELIGRALLGDRVRADATEAVDSLRKLGLSPKILTGDNRAAALAVAEKVGIPAQDVHAETTPESKSRIVAGNPHAVMVGDGANDAIALAAANVGVAVHGGMEVSLRAADVYLQKQGLHSIHKMIKISHQTMRVLKRNLIFSLLYNVVGVTAVLTGIIGPLFAAVFMPLSAFTVFTSSLIGTRELRRMLRGVES